MIFVDTNYFLRFLLGDNISQHKEAKEIFLQAAEGKIELFTSLLVIFEIYWVLTSFYEKQKDEISKTLTDILNLEFILLEEKEILRKAVSTYETTSFDLEDSFNLSFAKSKKTIDFKTFDIKLQKVFFGKLA